MPECRITEFDIFTDIIAPSQSHLGVEVARAFLRWKFSEGAIARMNVVATRNNIGAITVEKREDPERYLRVGSLINLLQAKARLSLKSAAMSTTDGPVSMCGQARTLGFHFRIRSRGPCACRSPGCCRRSGR